MIAPAFWWATFHWRSSVSVFTGAFGPSVASHALKSRFIPYLNTIEQSASLPFALSRPLHTFQPRKLSAAAGATTLGMSAGSTISAPCALRTAIASAIARVWPSFSPPRGSFAPGGVVLS